MSDPSDKPTRTRQMQWPRFLLEGVVIVGSILLTFGIEAWWAERQERAEEQRLLQNLHEEFVETRESVDIGTILNTSFRAIEDANPGLNGVFQDVDFANKERFPDHLLDSLLQHFEIHRMRRSDVDSTVLGDAYEYLIAKFERRKPRTPRSWRGPAP